MTLFTSVTDINKRRYLKTLINYVLISVLCIIFNAVYTHFSYGMFSYHMRFMFLFPLIGGALLCAIILLLKLYTRVTRASFNLWNSGIATFVVGCTVQGIINISGRNTDYGMIYWCLGALLLLSGIIALFIKKNN